MRGKKILFIDDEYKTSHWGDIFNAIFDNDVIEAVWNSWQTSKDVLNDENINEKLIVRDYLLPYDLILLDLRLIKEDEKIDGAIEADRLSGIQLLKKIREIDPTVPIVLFTASNKVYNIKEAEKLNIDDYFPKEVHYTYEEAGNYYERLKECFRKLLTFERQSLREVWGGIKTYKDTISKTKKIDIVPYLKNAHDLLSTYLRSRNSACPPSAIIQLGNLIEEIYGQNNLLTSSVDRMLDYLRHHLVNEEEGIKDLPLVNEKEGIKDQPLVNEKERIKDLLHAFITYWLRHSAAHPPSQIIFKDALFALFVVLKTLGIALSPKWEDPYPEWTPPAEEMVDLICSKNCDKSCHSFFNDYKYSCINEGTLINIRPKNNGDVSQAKEPKPIDKAKFFMLPHNLRGFKKNVSSQVFFTYLFYLLSIEEIGQTIPANILSLIKCRLYPFYCYVKKEELKGKVKWFDRTMGYGFIQLSCGCDIYVNSQDIKETTQSLNKGDEVKFKITMLEGKAPRALQVSAENVEEA